MGANNDKSALDTTSVGSLSADEIHQLKSTFNTMVTNDSKSNKLTMTFHQFQTGTRALLSTGAQQRTYAALRHLTISRRHRTTTDNDTTIVAWMMLADLLLKGSIDDQAQVIRRIVSDDDILEQASIEQFLIDLLQSYYLCARDSIELKSWMKLQSNDRFTHLLKQYLHDELRHYTKDDKVVDLFQLEKWISNSILLSTLIDVVYRSVLGMKSADRSTITAIPLCFGVDWSRQINVSMLTMPTLLFINANLPVEHRKQWKLLFSSTVHGESFMKLSKHIDGMGACIVLVKTVGTSSSRMFGAFASAGFVSGPSFVGDERCFLFSIEPTFRIYSPTGYNANFAYLNSNQKTIPNGLVGFDKIYPNFCFQGMGGSLEANFWSFYLDSEYGVGRSQPNGTTFTCASSLAGDDGGNFRIDRVEVWAVGERKKAIVAEGDDDNVQRSTILDMDPEMKAILEMAGRTMASDGLRETDAVAALPAERSLHPSTTTGAGV